MKKGFTLIELLVVIGILAILTAAVVVVLNPAELLRQSRDAQRLSDLDSVRSAVSLYLATAASPALVVTGGKPNCTASTTDPGGNSCNTNALTAVSGGGWVDANLSGAVGGSPLSALPIDPVEDGDHYYAYMASTTALTFELNGKLESTKYNSRMSSDGGDNSSWYELGTYPGLDLMN